MRKKKYTNYVGVLFDDETYSKLVHIIDEAEVSLSEFVRTVIEAKLKNENKENLKNENNI
jgi:predicted CopG family antitoxin